MLLSLLQNHDGFTSLARPICTSLRAATPYRIVLMKSTNEAADRAAKARQLKLV